MTLLGDDIGVTDTLAFRGLDVDEAEIDDERLI